MTTRTFAFCVALAAAILSGCNAPQFGHGDLPPKTTSEYLVTTSSGFDYDWRNPPIPPFRGSGRLRVSLRKPLPPGTYFEATFESPVAGEPILVAETLTGAEEELAFHTPMRKDWRRGTYVTTIAIYTDATKSELLGTHEQATRSFHTLRTVSDPRQLWKP